MVGFNTPLLPPRDLRATSPTAGSRPPHLDIRRYGRSWEIYGPRIRNSSDFFAILDLEEKMIENDSKQFKLLDGMECPILSQTPMGGGYVRPTIYGSMSRPVLPSPLYVYVRMMFFGHLLCFIDLWIDYHVSTHFKGTIRRDCARNLGDHVKPQISKLQTQPQNVIEMFQRHARHSQPTNKKHEDLLGFKTCFLPVESPMMSFRTSSRLAIPVLIP